MYTYETYGFEGVIAVNFGYYAGKETDTVPIHEIPIPIPIDPIGIGISASVSFPAITE